MPGAVMLVAAIMVLGLAEPASAQAIGLFFEKLQGKSTTIFSDSKQVFYIIAGFGLVGLTLGTVFGRLNWKWLGAWAFGCVIVAAAFGIIAEITGDDEGFAPPQYG